VRNTVREDEKESHGTNKWRANPIKTLKVKKKNPAVCSCRHSKSSA
jgi:hypothetical protein